jgi:putative ABC transport system permease protein
MTLSSHRAGPAEGTATSKVRGIPTNRLWETVLTAFAAIRANRTRSLLTSLGIMIGVMNVVTMVALISGVNESVMGLFRTLGTNTFLVGKFPAGNVNYQQYLEYMKRKDFTAQDAEAVAEACPSVEAVSPQTIVARKVRRGSETTKDIMIIGVTPEYQYISESEVADGRFFAWPESDRRRQVAVLGSTVRDHLFGSVDAVGREVIIDNRRFLVVGVMERMGEMFGQSMDDYVIVPFATATKLYGERLMTRVSVKARSAALLDQAMVETEQVLRQRRGLRSGDPNDFDVTTQSQLVEMYQNLTRVTWIVMIGISAIALAVGGVGIMNIMLVSVTERTREIGIRKAVGARARDVAVQFLVEAAVLSAFGGLCGLAVAAGLAGLIAAATPIPALIQPWSIAVALGVSIGVGVFFGLYPASKAARLDPIVALRYE